MANIALGIWLILFCVPVLVTTDVPKWVLGLIAGVTGAIVLYSGGWKKQP